MIDSWILASVLILLRVAAFVGFLPPVAGQGIPATVKIGLSVAISFLLVQTHAAESALYLNHYAGAEGAWMQLAFFAIRETALGAALAWLFSLCLVPIRVGGAWVAQEMGLTLGGLSSPLDQQPGNVISQMLEALGVLMFFLLNLHHALFFSLGTSFSLRPAASDWAMPSWSLVIRSVSMSVGEGFIVIGPVAILLFVVSLTILVTLKSAPQFNFMSYGMTLRLIAGLGGMVLFLPEICGVVQRLLMTVGREASG